MELSILFLISFIFVAVWTNKDLAWVAAAISAMGVYSASTAVSVEGLIVSLCGLNSLMVIMAGAYYIANRKPLSIAVMTIGTLAALNDFSRLYDISGSLTLGVSIVLGISLLLCLFFMDGTKGLMRGFADDCRGFWLRHVSDTRRHNLDKGWK